MKKDLLKEEYHRRIEYLREKASEPDPFIQEWERRVNTLKGKGVWGYVESKLEHYFHQIEKRTNKNVKDMDSDEYIAYSISKILEDYNPKIVVGDDLKQAIILSNKDIEWDHQKRQYNGFSYSIHIMKGEPIFISIANGMSFYFIKRDKEDTKDIDFLKMDFFLNGFHTIQPKDSN